MLRASKVVILAAGAVRGLKLVYVKHFLFFSLVSSGPSDAWCWVLDVAFRSRKGPTAVGYLSAPQTLMVMSECMGMLLNYIEKAWFFSSIENVAVGSTKLQ